MLARWDWALECDPGPRLWRQRKRNGHGRDVERQRLAPRETLLQHTGVDADALDTLAAARALDFNQRHLWSSSPCHLIETSSHWLLVKPFRGADDPAGDQVLYIGSGVAQLGEDRRRIGADAGCRCRTWRGLTVEREP
jgi:hypothetical protein